LRALALTTIRANSRRDITLNNVVTKDYANGIFGSKVFYERKRVGNTAFAFLISVIEMFQSEGLAISKQAQEIAGRVSTSHNHDVGDTRIDQRLNRIVDHRLIENWQQMFISYRSEGT